MKKEERRRKVKVRGVKSDEGWKEMKKKRRKIKMRGLKNDEEKEMKRIRKTRLKKQDEKKVVSVWEEDE